MFNEKQCFNYMLNIIRFDNIENATILCEMYSEYEEHDEWLDDENHAIWQVALDVIDYFNEGVE